MTCICGSFAVNELNNPRSFGDWFPAATNGLKSLRQRVDVRAGLIENLEFETAEAAQARDRRRVEGDDDRTGNRKERTADPPQHRLQHVVAAPCADRTA